MPYQELSAAVGEPRAEARNEAVSRLVRHTASDAPPPSPTAQEASEAEDSLESQDAADVTDAADAADATDGPPAASGEPTPGELELAEERVSVDSEPVDDVVRMWLREVGRTPLLRYEDEVSLAKQVERGTLAARALRNAAREIGGEQRGSLMRMVERGHTARERLTSANLRLVVAMAKRYVGRGLNFGDLIQEGNLGLLRAVEKYDYRRGLKFSTYATWWIRQSISRAIADQGRTIRVPVHVVECINRVIRAQNMLLQVLGREPTAEEVADHVGLPVERVHEVTRVAPEPMSLEAPLGEGDEGHLADFLVDMDAASPSESLSRKAMQDQLHTLLREILSPREREVLSLRYGLRDGLPRTLEEVGATMAVTRERIRQIEARALKKLRHPSRGDRLRDLMER